MELYEYKKMVCERSKEAYAEGLLEGMNGNLSVFAREHGAVVITPSQFPYEEYTPEEMVVIDLDGNLIEAPHKPSSEWIMHTMVYKAREDVNAVFHTHSPYASAFAVAHRPIPAILVEMIPMLGDYVPLAEFSMPGTEEMGLNAFKVLDGFGGCLLMNHGVLAIGTTLHEAYLRAGYIETGARVCALAESLGGAFPLTEQQARAVASHYGMLGTREEE